MTPTRKVTAGAGCGALVTVAVWILQQNKIEVPAVVSAAAVTALSFLVSYFTRELAVIVQHTHRRKRRK